MRHVAAMRGACTISKADLADAPAIAAIYAHHVRYGVATFETAAPDAAEIAARMRKVADAGWPWLVARDAAGDVTGYAYAAQFRDRAAYGYACENSIYLRADRLGQGIGTALLHALLEAAEAAGFRQMLAVIAGSEAASVALHARAGFVECGRMTAVGRKHGRWLDVISMQRALGEGDRTPPPVEPDFA